MESLKFGNLLPDPEPFFDDNINDTFIGMVDFGKNTEAVRAIVKFIGSHRELFVECACAILGRELGLPIPQPMLVKVSHMVLPDKVRPQKNKIIFGSEYTNYPSLRQALLNREIALQQYKKFSQLIDIGVFDEWIANGDRNPGNILYDGEDKLIFIDHGQALEQSLKFDELTSKNTALKYSTQYLDELSKYRILKKVEQTYVPQYKKVPLPVISEKVYGTRYLDSEEITDIINFLSERLPVLSELIRLRINPQQQEMALS